MSAHPAASALSAGVRLRHFLMSPAGIVLVLAALMLPSLGIFPLFNDDEGAFSEATREMLRSGDWVSTTLNGADRFDKPILIYWLQAASVHLFGLNESALRLPSALATLAWVGAIARFAAPRFGPATAWLAACIAASSVGVLAIGRAATADALLNLFIALTMFDLWQQIEGGLPDTRPATQHARWRTYVWIGLGILTKGPIAVLIPGAVGALLGIQRNARTAIWRIAFYPAGWAIAAAIALPWYTLEWLAHGKAFIDGFFLHHNLDRFHGALEGHHGSVFYYVVLVPALLLPWSALLAPLIARSRALWSDPLHRFLFLWFGFVLVFFSLSGTKLPHYMMYGLTPVFLLLALVARERAAWLLLAPPLAGIAVLPAAPWLVAYWVQQHAATIAAPYVAQAARATSIAASLHYLLISSCCLGAGALFCIFPRRFVPWQRAALLGAAWAASLMYAFTPWLGAVLQGPVRNAAIVARLSQRQAVQWNYSAPSFSVYREQITPSRPPEPGELAITRVDRLPPEVPVLVLYEEGGIALIERLDSPVLTTPMTDAPSSRPQSRVQ